MSMQAITWSVSLSLSILSIISSCSASTESDANVLWKRSSNWNRKDASSSSSSSRRPKDEIDMNTFVHPYPQYIDTSGPESDWVEIEVPPWPAKHPYDQVPPIEYFAEKEELARLHSLKAYREGDIKAFGDYCKKMEEYEYIQKILKSGEPDWIREKFKSYDYWTRMIRDNQDLDTMRTKQRKSKKAIAWKNLWDERLRATGRESELIRYREHPVYHPLILD